MRRFEARYYNRVDEEIRRFVKDALEAGRTSFMDVNGIRLIVDPRYVADVAEYTDQLIWTFNKVMDDDGVLPNRHSYVNQVPILQKLAKQKLLEFAKLDMLDTRAIILWLLEVAPATHNTWSWSAKDGRRVANKLIVWNTRRRNAHKPPMLPSAFQEADRLIRTASSTLAAPGHGHIVVGWIQAAQEWNR